MYWISHALIWTNLLFYLISTFLEIFACTPIAKAWDPLITNGHCINVLALNVAASSINSLSDIGILILPQVSIWRLQMALRRKVQISTVFLIGSFACVCSILRLSYAVRLYRATDLTYYSWVTGVWTYPEMASGIIVGCLPVSAKFFQGLKERRMFSKFGSSLKSLLHFTTVASRRSIDNYSAETQTTSKGPGFGNKRARPKHYNTLPDGQPLADKTSTDPTRSEDEHYQPEAYIMRTMDIEAHSEPKDDSRPDSTHGFANVWQGQ